MLFADGQNLRGLMERTGDEMAVSDVLQLGPCFGTRGLRLGTTGAEDTA